MTRTVATALMDPHRNPRLAWLALLHALLISASPQERLPLQIAPGDLGMKIGWDEEGRSIKLSPSGSMRPIFYRTTQDLSLPISRWTAVPATADPAWVNDGELTLTNSQSTRYYRAAYPDFSKLNGFVRVPTNAIPEELTTLVVVLHPSTLGRNSGYALETQDAVSPFCDKYKLVSYFPSALNFDGSDNRWNGLTGPQASDYAALTDGIRRCRNLAPTLKKVKLLAYSDGVGTAIGLAHLYPGEIDGLLLFAGYNNGRTAQYVEAMNGGKPVRFARPIPIVGIVSPRDTDFVDEIRAACAWFAAANGFAGTPVTNSIKRDYNEFVAGVDSTVVEMGDHVRYILSDAKDHFESMFSSTNGLKVLFDGFLKNGVMPGKETD